MADGENYAVRMVRALHHRGPGKAKKHLGWARIRFKELVHLMVDADIEALPRTTCERID